MAPYLHQDDLSLVGKIVSVAYPIGDVILIGAAVRLALDTGRREPAFHLLTGSIALLLVTDFAYGLLTLHGGYDHQLWLDAGWIGSYLLWGAAGLHPSMARLDQPSPGREIVLTPFRLGLLTCASLMAPAIGIIHDLRAGDLDYTVVRVASITLFGLVVVRMAGLVRQQDRSLERERALSGAGAELVAATTRGEIDRVAVARPPALAASRRVRRAVPTRRRPERCASTPSVPTGISPPGHRSLPGGWTAPQHAASRPCAWRRPRRSPPGCRRRIRRVQLVGARAAPRRRRGRAGRGRGQRLQGRARGVAGARDPGRTRPRQRGAERGGAPAAGRGALRVARAPRERPHHRARARHDRQLPEPVDRARPGLRAGRSRRHAIRPPGVGRRPRSACARASPP